jgi:hypothetical protein
MNQPYVKKYDQFGELINPINNFLFSQFPNRRQRRRGLFGRPHGWKRLQLIIDKKGNKKTIFHYS